MGADSRDGVRVNESEVTSHQANPVPTSPSPGSWASKPSASSTSLPVRKSPLRWAVSARAIDGSDAEYTLVDAANVIPFDTDLGCPD